MKKVLTKFFSLLFAFAFSFFCCGCIDGGQSFERIKISDLNVPKVDIDGYVKDNDLSGMQDYKEPHDMLKDYAKNVEIEFYQQNGEYIHYKGYWDDYKGVRLVSVPTNNDEAELEEDEQVFYDNLDEQFELIYLFIKNYMKGKFSSGINAQNLEVSDIYKADIPEIKPDVKQSFGASVEHNKKIGNSTENIMNSYLTGWTYSKVGSNYELTTKRSSSDVSKKFLVDFSSSADEDVVKNFVTIRLMEIALERSEKTTYGTASNETEATNLIKNYKKLFKQLGFSYADLETAMKTFIREELIGQDVINYYKSQLHLSEPYYAKLVSDAFGYVSKILEEDSSLFASFPGINGILQYFFDLNHNNIQDNGEPLLEDVKYFVVDGIRIYYIDNNADDEYNTGDTLFGDVKYFEDNGTNYFYLDIKENEDDIDGDGVFIEGTDILLIENIVYDDVGNFYYVDANQNNTFDVGEQILLKETDATDATNYFYYIDTNSDGVYTAGEKMFKELSSIEGNIRYYDDEDGEGKFSLMPYFDINKNGHYDFNFAVRRNLSDAFYFDLENYVDELSDYLKALVDGEPFTDSNNNGQYDDGELYDDINQNGQYDEGLIKVLKMKIKDLEAKNYFYPGEKEEFDEDGNTTQKRVLGKRDTNSEDYKNYIEYDEYKSVLYLAKQDVNMQLLSIYVDSLEDFVLDVYMKIHLDENNYFVMRVCSLNLDHTKNCDWYISENPKNYDDDYDELFDVASDHKQNGYLFIDMAHLADYYVENNKTDYFILQSSLTEEQRQNLLTKLNNEQLEKLDEDEKANYTPLTELTDAHIMQWMMTSSGIKAIGEELGYTDRTYYSSGANFDLAKNYSYQTISTHGEAYTDSNGNGQYDEGEEFFDANSNQKYDSETKALCYDNKSESYIEFLFNIPERVDGNNYDFRFLITTPEISFDFDEDSSEEATGGSTGE